MFYSVSALRRKQVGRSERLNHSARLLRNVTVSVLALGMLAIVAGILYTYLAHDPAPIDSPTPTTNYTGASLFQPKPANPKSPAHASVQSMSSPVKAGEAVSLSVRTNAGATCAVKLDRAVGGVIPDAVADVYGIVMWSWQTTPKTQVGTVGVTVTCNFNDKSAVVQTAFEIIA